MLFAASGLEGCAVKASDGDIGSVSDFLFDNRTWAVRWLAVDTGRWLPGRKALIHPSAIAPLELPPKPALPMMTGGDRLELSVNLTRGQIEAGPHLGEDEPVTRDMESLLYDYYAWDPYWSMTHFGGAALPNAEARLAGDAEHGAEFHPADGADHLHSAAAFRGYAVHALDGDIGHVENLLVEDFELGDPLSRHRDPQLVAGQDRAAFALCGEGRRLVRPAHRHERKPRAGDVGAGLRPSGADGRGNRGRAPPPFRLAGVRAVGGCSEGGDARSGERSRTSSDFEPREVPVMGIAAR